MQKEFKWGIIGPGRIAGKFAECLQALPASRLRAIASRSARNLEERRKSLRAEKAYGSYEELAEDPEIQAIYIATPHRFHFENARLCLSRHKPVLIEKAVTVNRFEFQQLIELAAENSLFLMEAMWMRFLPVFKQIRRWLNDGEIGSPQAVTSTMGFIAAREPDDRFLNPQLAGGAILDLSVYNVAAAQLVFRELPIEIKAHAMIGPTGVDEVLNASLNYGHGRLSRIFCTLLAEPDGALQIWGEKGNILTEAPFDSAQKVSLYNHQGEDVFEEPYRVNGFEYQIEEAQRCISAGLIESPIMSHADSLDVLAILDEFRRQVNLRYPFEE